MADFNALEALINAYIKQNGVKAITGNILNGVLRGMVSALGKGWTIADGDATPTMDPGTMTGPVAYIAHTAGTYEHFGNLVVNDGEVALLKYNEQTWTKEVIVSLAATASIDGNVGTPAVDVTFQNGVLSFDFRNMKGNTGDAAGFGTVNATVDANIGTPGVSVQTSGPDTGKNITFEFRNLKGETGVTSVVATVDNTVGTPSCAVSLVGQELHLAFSGLKGAQGDTGSSVDYPFTIVNNLTTNDASQALSAAMGVQLESEISQLEHKMDEDLYGTETDTYTSSGYNQYVGNYDFEKGVEYTIKFTSNYTGTMYVVIVDSDHNALNTQVGMTSFPYTITFKPTANYTGAQFKMGQSGSATYTIEVKQKNLIQKVDELYENNAVSLLYKRETAAVNTAINESVDVSSVPEGAQIILSVNSIAGTGGTELFPKGVTNAMSSVIPISTTGKFYFQKISDLKSLQVSKSASTGNVLNFTVSFIPLAYPIEFRNMGAYCRKPNQKLYIGEWIRGFYLVTNGVPVYSDNNSYMVTPVNYTGGLKIRVNCSDFSTYNVNLIMFSPDFSYARVVNITAQTDIDLSYGYGWVIQYRKQDYSILYPWKDGNVVSITYLSGTIYERSANDSDLRKVSDTIPTVRKMDFFYDEFRTHPYIFHYAPDGLLKDGANNAIIGGQSEDGIRMAKRLGFRMIEANIQKTSDDKYVVFHGSNNNFGPNLFSLDNTDITNVAISSKSLSWIKENVRFRSTVDKYKTPLLSIEEWCSLCRENGLAVLAGVVQDAALLPILQRMLGNNFILYNPPANARELGFNGFCMEYKPANTETVDTLLQSAEKFGKPYMCSISVELYNALVGNNTFDTLLYEMHKRGYIVGMSYINDAVAHDALAKGVDNIASISQVNPFEGGEIYDINGDVSVFSGTGTIADNEATLATGETIICGSADAMPLGKGEVNIRFNGSLTFTFGSAIPRNISSDGTTFIRLSDFFLRRKPQLTITAVSATEITELVYKVKRC